MFLENPIALAAFDRLFREREDGSLVFQPKGSDVAVPVDPEEYDALRLAYTRLHARHQMILMASGALAGGYALVSLIRDGSYGTFFWVIGGWFILNVAMQGRDIETLVAKQINKQRALLVAEALPKD